MHESKKIWRLYVQRIAWQACHTEKVASGFCAWARRPRAKLVVTRPTAARSGGMACLNGEALFSFTIEARSRAGEGGLGFNWKKEMAVCAADRHMRRPILHDLSLDKEMVRNRFGPTTGL